MATSRTITKALGGAEDLLFGQGSVTQTRNGVPVQVSKINGSVIPYSGDTSSGDMVSLTEQINNLDAAINDADTAISNLDAAKANVGLDNVADAVVLDKVKNVDGTGSGLDADTVDGLHASQFLRSDVNDGSSAMKRFWTSGTNTDDFTNSPISIRERDLIGIGSADLKYAPNINFHWDGRATRSLYMLADGQLNYGEYDTAGNPIGHKIWNAGNDGAGSGLDADLVRGLPADFTISKTTNGYQKLPSGLIIQWGYTTVSDVIFPIAFPNAALNTSMTKGRVDGTTPANTGEPRIGNVTKTGMNVVAWGGSGDVTSQGILWMAIGY